MNDTQANIILRLKDEFSKNLQNAGRNFESFARSVDQVGASMSRTGAKMVAVGTTMNAPFFAAAAAMSKYSFDAQQQMNRLNNEILSLSKVISEAAMPTIKAFNDNFSKAVNILKSLDPAILENIAHWSMMVGQILIAVGAFEIFVGKTLSLMSKMASGTLGKINAIVGAIALLTWAWTQHHDAFMKVLNAIDIGFNSFVVGILAGCKAMTEGLVNLSKVFPPMAGMTGPLQKGLDSLNGAISAFKQNIAQAQSGNGAFAQTVNSFGSGLTQAASNSKKAWDDAEVHLETVSEDIKMRFESLGNSISDGFGDAFSRVLVEGQSFADSMKRLFQGIAESIIKDFSSTIMKNIFGSLLGVTDTNTGTGIGGLLAGVMGSGAGAAAGDAALMSYMDGLMSFHSGGMIGPIYAHSGLAPDEVPIIAQTGEGVLSRKGMAALGGSNNLRKLNAGGSNGGGQTIVINQVIQAWDASDVYKNRKTLTAAIAQDIKNNGTIRQTMKNYQ